VPDEWRKKFSDQEMDIARETSLPGLLSHLGYQVTRVGSYYSTKEMDSLRVKQSNPAYFKRYSSEERGDAITFLELYENKSFEEAVDYLLSYHGYSKDKPLPLRFHKRKPPPEEPKQEFVLPEPHTDCRRVFAYLLKRGISRDIIHDYVKQGLLYECKEYHNCVFTGKNGGGKVVFAYKRGTYDKNGEGFKGDVAGSDKAIAFRLPASGKSKKAFVFESPLDLMSHAAVYGYPTVNAVALCCLWDGALETYLKENPHLKEIVLCLDNDQWGKKATMEIGRKYEESGYAVRVKYPKAGKDWNEALQAKKRKSKLRGRR
jgi:hypothetical protein